MNTSQSLTKWNLRVNYFYVKPLVYYKTLVLIMGPTMYDAHIEWKCETHYETRSVLLKQCYQIWKPFVFQLRLVYKSVNMHAALWGWARKLESFGSRPISPKFSPFTIPAAAMVWFAPGPDSITTNSKPAQQLIILATSRSIGLVSWFCNFLDGVRWNWRFRRGENHVYIHIIAEERVERWVSIITGTRRSGCQSD